MQIKNLKESPMALSREDRIAAEALLLNGGSIPDVMERFDISVASAHNIKRSLKSKFEADAVKNLRGIQPEILEAAVSQVKKNSSDYGISTELDKVVDSAAGLQTLDLKFQTTMSSILSRFNSFINDPNLEVKEALQITNAVASAYEKVFRSGTNIHIGDNNSASSQKLTIFKSRQGV